MQQAFKVNGGQQIGALDPKAYAGYQEFLLAEKLVKKAVEPKTYLHTDAAFLRAVNNFDHQAVIEAAKLCSPAH